MTAVWQYPIRQPIEDTANARRHLRAARHLIDDAEPRIHQALETLVLLAADGYSAGTGGITAGVSDPTGAAVLARTTDGPRDGAADLWAQITGLSGELHGIATQLIKAIQRVPTPTDTAATARQHRCTGGTGMEGDDAWGDPTCERLSIIDGLCDACRQRRAHWRTNPDYRPRPARRRTL